MLDMFMYFRFFLESVPPQLHISRPSNQQSRHLRGVFILLSLLFVWIMEKNYPTVQVRVRVTMPGLILPVGMV